MMFTLKHERPFPLKLLKAGLYSAAFEGDCRMPNVLEVKVYNITFNEKIS